MMSRPLVASSNLVGEQISVVFCSQVEFLLSGRGPKGVSKEGCGKLGVSGIEK